MGAIFLAIVILVLFLIGLAAHFLSTQLHRRLVRAGNRYARAYRIMTFIFTFLLLFVGVAIVFLLNLPFTR